MDNKRKYFSILLTVVSILFLVPYSIYAQKQYPSQVTVVLNKSNGNKSELEKVIAHFNKPEDSLKLKATYFLISNMDIHHSESYYWADSSGKYVTYDELNYPDFTTALKAFDSVKKTVRKIHPVPYAYRDIDTIKAEFLIDNINQAFELWHRPLANQIPFADFCEYLLPYRISIEPIQDWRTVYKNRFNLASEKSDQIDSVLRYLKKDMTNWFTCTYNLEKRPDPIPRLGALQLLQRKKGPCEDIADLAVFALRSQGIPASIDHVPAWATSSGNHTLDVVFNSSVQPIHYDLLLLGDSIKEFIREPAKVIRATYSRQTNTLPYFENEENIPPGFMRLTNYKDVTQEYWQTKDITCNIFRLTKMPKIAYAAVLNYSNWTPTWWGFVKNDSVTFSSLCKGAVFLPMYYIGGKLRPAGYPVVSGYKSMKVLKPDTLNTRSITLKEEEHYLRYRSGKKYKLYYWNNYWKLIDEKIAAENTTELVFERVPKNALCILIPEYTQRKERPFSLNEKGEREWW
ncbi:MAG TPA: transglutaminase domain-containing protein [Chryseobacterium sp.]|nr:transglutaminase domain-containing protein [Chryseobacterium sp.]